MKHHPGDGGRKPDFWHDTAIGYLIYPDQEKVLDIVRMNNHFQFHLRKECCEKVPTIEAVSCFGETGMYPRKFPCFKRTVE